MRSCYTLFENLRISIRLRQVPKLKLFSRLYRRLPQADPASGSGQGPGSKWLNSQSPPIFDQAAMRALSTRKSACDIARDPPNC